MEAVSYETTFASDRFNEHRSEEYLFKLGCALIEQHWKEQVRTASRALACVPISDTRRRYTPRYRDSPPLRHCCRSHGHTHKQGPIQRGTYNPLSPRLLHNALRVHTQRARYQYQKPSSTADLHCSPPGSFFILAHARQLECVRIPFKVPRVASPAHLSCRDGERHRVFVDDTRHIHQRMNGWQRHIYLSSPTVSFSSKHNGPCTFGDRIGGTDKLRRCRVPNATGSPVSVRSTSTVQVPVLTV